MQLMHRNLPARPSLCGPSTKTSLGIRRGSSSLVGAHRYRLRHTQQVFLAAFVDISNLVTETVLGQWNAVTGAELT